MLPVSRGPHLTNVSTVVPPIDNGLLYPLLDKMSTFGRSSSLRALQFSVAGHRLAGRLRYVLPAFLVPGLYLSAADLVAIRSGIWTISPRATTGLHVGDLPIEEAVFFFVTSAMVVFGVELLVDAQLSRRHLSETPASFAAAQKAEA